MSKNGPIPDEVLRRLADTHIVRYLPDPGEEDDGVLLGRTMLKHLDDCVTGGFYFEVCDEAAAGLRCDLRDLARELLALRKAARLIFDGMSGTWAEVDPPTLDVIRALLPEEAK